MAEQGYKRVPTLNNADPPRHAPMRKAVFACMSRARLRALEPLFYFEFQAPNRFQTTILEGTADDLKWDRVDGGVWIQS